VGDKFAWGGFTFQVTAKDGARLERIRVTKRQPPAGAPTTAQA
jgi:CBS domain containing-hemolysin-like protein